MLSVVQGSDRLHVKVFSASYLCVHMCIVLAQISMCLGLLLSDLHRYSACLMVHPCAARVQDWLFVTMAAILWRQVMDGFRRQLHLRQLYRSQAHLPSCICSRFGILLGTSAT